MGNMAGSTPATCGLLILSMFIAALMAFISNYVLLLLPNNIVKSNITKGADMKKVKIASTALIAGALQSGSAFIVSVVAGSVLP